jgi:hypothetical protein
MWAGLQAPDSERFTLVWESQVIAFLRFFKAARASCSAGSPG